MTEVKSLYNMGYEQGMKDTLDKYDEPCRIASYIRVAMGCETAKDCWELIRTGEIQKVKHGRWCKTGQSLVYSDKFRNYFCSECGFELDEHIKTELPYCPNCGADMRGGEDGNID